MIRQLFRARTTGALLALTSAACASSGIPWKPPATLDTGDVPAKVRPAFGNAELHAWWPLTAPEVAALKNLEQARQGDAHALLALGILASGGDRDPAAYARIEQRVDRFLADMKPVMDAAGDDWHRGYELHRAMHRVFFNARGELEGYEFSQARLSGIFAGGRYNCLSSAMLFVVLARGFGLPVRAAMVPTHVFVEMGVPGGKIIEVETTSATGFDWVHNERFYKEAAYKWSANRGLRPVTLDEYQHRTILEPYQLMAYAMRDGQIAASDQERDRLYEVSALVSPDSPDFQMSRVQVYDNEAHDLYEAKAWRTMAAMFDVVGPAVAEVGARSKDSRTLELVSWARWHQANALMIVGRKSEAMPLLAEGLEHVDPSWKDAVALRTNYAALFNDVLCELIANKDYAGAAKVYAEHRDACRADRVCAGNVAVIYGNWSADYANAGDWPSARRALQECVSELPNDSRCRDALADLESRHQF
ncbi:MAG TPA: hypothetical protein VIF57_05825 [Polyangia bacterium]